MNRVIIGLVIISHCFSSVAFAQDVLTPYALFLHDELCAPYMDENSQYDYSIIKYFDDEGHSCCLYYDYRLYSLVVSEVSTQIPGRQLFYCKVPANVNESLRGLVIGAISSSSYRALSSISDTPYFFSYQFFTSLATPWGGNCEQLRSLVDDIIEHVKHQDACALCLLSERCDELMLIFESFNAPVPPGFLKRE